MFTMCSLYIHYMFTICSLQAAITAKVSCVGIWERAQGAEMWFSAGLRAYSTFAGLSITIIFISWWWLLITFQNFSSFIDTNLLTQKNSKDQRRRYELWTLFTYSNNFYQILHQYHKVLHKASILSYWWNNCFIVWLIFSFFLSYFSAYVLSWTRLGLLLKFFLYDFNCFDARSHPSYSW